MALPSFAPSAAVELAVTSTSANIVLPASGSPTTALVSNLSAAPVYVALGTSSVTATIGANVAVMPMAQLALTIGANTYLAAVSETTGALNIAVGS
jgi:hypothetical protein